MISPYEAGFLFVFKARRRAHSWDTVTEAATLKTGKKTHKMGILFASKSLGPCMRLLLGVFFWVLRR